MTAVETPADHSTSLTEPSGRQMYWLAWIDHGGRYDSWKEEKITPVSEAAEGNIVGSLVSGDAHKPLFDFDGPVALVQTGKDLCLWIDVPKRRRAWRVLAGLFEEAGIAKEGTESDARLSRRRRREMYRSSQMNCQDPGPLTEWIRDLGPTWHGSFDELVSTVKLMRTCEQPADYQEEQVRGPTMKNPFPLRLSTPVTLVRSTHNHHLYVEHEISWTSFKAVLTAAKKSGIIERGYVETSLGRGYTCLRPPWVLK
jgi:hypothetical protein